MEKLLAVWWFVSALQPAPSSRVYLWHHGHIQHVLSTPPQLRLDLDQTSPKLRNVCACSSVYAELQLSTET